MSFNKLPITKQEKNYIYLFFVVVVFLRNDVKFNGSYLYLAHILFPHPFQMNDKENDGEEDKKEDKEEAMEVDEKSETKSEEEKEKSGDEKKESPEKEKEIQEETDKKPETTETDSNGKGLV